MADTTTELEVLDQIVDVLGGQSGQYETVVPVLQQIKELLASGITDPEAIAEAVTAWLDEHPEATTTVRDGSITIMKLAQDVVELLDNKADIDGYYSQLTAGLAENLIGRGDAVPAEYLYRTAGGTADIEDGIATIDCIKGNTLVWNQLVQVADATRTSNGVTFVSSSDGTVVANGEASGNTYATTIDISGIVSGHVYLFKCAPAGGSESTYRAYLQGDPFTGVSSRFDYGSGTIATAVASGTASIEPLYVYSGYTANNLVAIPQLFDLTQMFGSGNEPATVEEFEAMFPLTYYPYSAPKLLPVDIRGIETVGFNAYNPSTGEAELLGGHQYQISGTYTSLSYSTGESIALDSDGIFTPSENGTLTVTGGNATDTCVHLVWSGYRNGEYEEYWSAERPIDTSRFFPTGTKKAGDKADALYADHYDTVIGAVDLGTLTWTRSGNRWASYDLVGIIATVAASADIPNIIAEKYKVIPSTGSLDNNRDAITVLFGQPGVLFAYGDDSTPSPTGMMFYELATPTTTEIDPPLNLSYKVSDFGTERIMVGETADAPQTAPVPMEVEYGINAIDTIRRLPKEYQSHKSMGQLTAALESSLGIDITETWDETEQRYEYEVSDFELADNSIPDSKLVQTGGVLERVTGLKSAVQDIADETPRNTNILPPYQEFGYYSETNGTPVDSQYYVRSTNAIKIPTGAVSLYIKFNAPASGYTAIVYYEDAEPTADNYISTSSFEQGTTSGQSSVPTGAKYFRVWVSQSSFILANLSIAVTNNAPYVPYSPIFKVHMENLPSALSNYDDASYTYDKTLHQWSELGATTNGYILENGTRAASSYLRISRYISVNAGDTITVKALNLNIGGTTIYGIACYDEDYNFIPNEGIKGNTSNVSGSFTVPTNCRYVAISDLKSSNSTFSIDEYTHNFGTKIAENTKRVSLNELYGKTICNFGDSIFGQARPPYDVSTKLAELTGATVYNCGFGGCQMGVHSNANFDAFSMYRLADAIASGDWTLQETAAQANEIPAYFAETVTLLQSLDFADIDIITIAYGTNDFTNGLQPVTSNNPDSGTNKFKAVGTALQYSIDKILSAYSNLRIFVCVPTYRVWLTSDNQFSEDSNTKVITAWVGGPEQDHTLLDFVAAENNVAKANQLPVIDNYYNLGINRYDWTEYFPATDGTHHNQTGRNLIAEHMAHCLW